MVSGNATLLIRGGRVIDPASGVDAVLDVLIQNGLIARLGSSLATPFAAAVYDATGKVVAPGFIDAHVHLREPGFEAKETIATGTAAAAAGGICAVVAMPNTLPPPDSAERLRLLAERVATTAAVRVYPVGCISRDRAGRDLAPLAEMARAGAVGFSDDGDSVDDRDLMRAALALAQSLALPICPHEEVKALSGGAPMHDGAASKRLGVAGMPAAAEEEMIARDLELVRETGGHLHVTHLSAAGSVAMLRRARQEGLPVSGEATTHHLTLVDDAVALHGSNAKMNPPLRRMEDMEALRQGLHDGVIDMIVTDHAPHTAAEKALPLNQAPFGVIGLETAVGLTLTHLVGSGVLDLGAAIHRWTVGPARVFNLPGGRLIPGAPGDVTVLDLDKEWAVEPERFRSKAHNTPFAGWRLRGRAVATIVGGQVVFREDAD